MRSCPIAQSLAEKEAWKLTKELDLDLVTILPTYVVGPLISERASTSVKFFVVRSCPCGQGSALELGFGMRSQEFRIRNLGS